MRAQRAIGNFPVCVGLKTYVIGDFVWDSAGRKIGSAVGFGDAMWLAVGWDLRAETAHEAIGIDTIIL